MYVLIRKLFILVVDRGIVALPGLLSFSGNVITSDIDHVVM